MMRSKDISKLAGVSIRTLRHYHQIGLLPEPPRQDNGYRSYGPLHLIRLLRIGQFTALGLSLSQLPALLDGDEQMSAERLSALHDGLTRQIEVLERQRQTVAALRDGKGPHDIPPQLAASLMALEVGRGEEAVRAGREQAVLFSHLLDEAGGGKLARLYEQLADPDHRAVAGTLGRRFDALGSGSDNVEIEKLADDYIEHLGLWMTQFHAVLSASVDPEAKTLLSVHAVESANKQQQKLLAEISIRLADQL